MGLNISTHPLEGPGWFLFMLTRPTNVSKWTASVEYHLKLWRDQSQIATRSISRHRTSAARRFRRVGFQCLKRLTHVLDVV